MLPLRRLTLVGSWVFPLTGGNCCGAQQGYLVSTYAWPPAFTYGVGACALTHENPYCSERLCQGSMGLQRSNIVQSSQGLGAQQTDNAGSCIRIEQAFEILGSAKNDGLKLSCRRVRVRDGRHTKACE